MTQILAAGALDNIKTLFDALGGLGGFIVAVIGVLIFLRDSDQKQQRKRPRKRQPGASHDNRNRPAKRAPSAPPQEQEAGSEVPADEDGGDPADGDEDEDFLDT